MTIAGLMVLGSLVEFVGCAFRGYILIYLHLSTLCPCAMLEQNLCIFFVVKYGFQKFIQWFQKFLATGRHFPLFFVDDLCCGSMN